LEIYDNANSVWNEYTTADTWISSHQAANFATDIYSAGETTIELADLTGYQLEDTTIMAKIKVSNPDAAPSLTLEY